VEADVSHHFLHVFIDRSSGGWEFGAVPRKLRMEDLTRLGWVESEWTRRRKGDTHKVNLGRRLRAETTMSLAWIAEHLRMDIWSYVSNLLMKTKSANSED